MTRKKTTGQRSEPVDTLLTEIEEQFHETTYRERLKSLVFGITKDQNTREYKEAQIELQRTSAPVLAVILPIFLVIVLICFTASTKIVEPVYKAEIIEVEEIVPLEKPKEPPPEKIPDQLDEALSETLTTQVTVETTTPTETTEYSPQPAEITAVIDIPSPVKLRGIYGDRGSTGVRGASLAKHGGDAYTEAAVMRALRWLKTQQLPGGNWGGGATGLALLAYLAHGERPGDASPEFGETVQRAIEYLSKPDRHFDHFTAYAIAEAYGMTLHPGVRESAERAIKQLIKTQLENGQWGKGGGGGPDLVGMTFNVLALKAAWMAGIRVPGLAEAMKKAVNGFAVQGNVERGGFQSDAFGPPGANFRKNGTWHFMMGVFGMQYLGSGKEPVVTKTLRVLDSIWPPATLGSTEIACCPVRSNYYSTMVYFNEGGERWTRWNAAMKKVYCEGQTVIKGKYKDHHGVEHDIGYWECEDQHIGDQPLMPTVYIAQQLMIYYRFLPSTTEKAWESKSDSGTAIADAKDVKIDTGTL